MMVALLCLFAVFVLSTCDVNLFISKDETSRTLGMAAELSYVEDGSVNQYSTRFPYRVETNVSQLKFSWSATDKVQYSLRVVSEDVAVLPVLRIARIGYVPLHNQEFAVEYRCAGSKAGQFEVSLYVNFTLADGKLTSLKLRQEKLCAARDGRRFLGGFEDTDSGRLEDAGGFPATETLFYAIVGCAAAFLVLIALLLLLYFRSSKKASGGTPTPVRSRLPSSFRSTRTAQSHQPFLTSTPNKSGSTLSTRVRGAGTSGSSLSRPARAPVDVKAALLDLYADRNLFTMLPFDELQGTFGEMKWAIWRQTASGVCGDIDEEEDAGTGDEAVLAKTLRATASQPQLEKFLQEALVFHNVPPHANLAQICAAASFGRFDRPETVTDFPLLCYRHRGFGNLKKFLLSCRADGGTLRRDKAAVSAGGQTLTTHELVSMGSQLCRAVSHLHRHGLVHRDIATRNCIVAEIPGRRSADRLHVQLTDNALSKDLFPGDYHCLGDNDNRPVCWLPPETLATNEYNNATDVWSFGVCLWELLSCGSQPLAAVDPDDVLVALQQGARPPQPYSCPDQLYGVMFCCWKLEPEDRPTAEQLILALHDFTQQLSQFI